MSYAVSTFDAATATDEELARMLEVVNRLDAEEEPRHSALNLDELRTVATWPGMTYHRLIVEDDDGSLVAVGGGRYPDDGTNPDLLLCSIRVLPEHRRKGIGSLVLRELCDLAEESGRTRLLGMYSDTVPSGEAFASSVGAEDGMQFHENVLPLAELDASLMDDWVQRGPGGAPGYRVELFDGPLPTNLHADVAHLYFVLERDMPMTDGFEPRSWTADTYARMEQHYVDSADSLTALAFAPNGTAVGMSQLIRRHTNPSTWIVSVTMVDPDHRGMSLGKWVKGVVNLAAIERWDGGVYQETGNAFMNEAMLAINHAMGFRHERTITDCSISVEGARAFLAGRGA